MGKLLEQYSEIDETIGEGARLDSCSKAALLSNTMWFFQLYTHLCMET